MKIVVLCSEGASTRILLNWLKDAEFVNVEVIREKSPSRAMVLRRRLRKHGLGIVLGQLMFLTIIVPILKQMSKKRAADILDEAGLRASDDDHFRTIDVKTVNSSEVVAQLSSINPDVVLVNGTRIISRDILSAVPAPFINLHVGITPAYRGVHGGYWALWCGDEDNFGATLHLVDPGVDTGQVLAQVRTRPTQRDNYFTYPILQQSITFGALREILERIGLGRPIVPISVSSEKSRQWFHPTLLEYLSGRFRGVK